MDLTMPLQLRSHPRTVKVCQLHLVKDVMLYFSSSNCSMLGTSQNLPPRLHFRIHSESATMRPFVISVGLMADQLRLSIQGLKLGLVATRASTTSLRPSTR